MKVETLDAISATLKADPELTAAKIQHALAILSPREHPDADYTRVIRYREAMSLLGITRQALQAYIRKGLFVRAYGSGQRFGIGITAESYNKFIHDHSRSGPSQPRQPGMSGREKQRIARENQIRKIRWGYHFTKETTRIDKFEAIARVLSSRKDVSLSAACLAADVTEASYRHYIRSITKPQSERSKRIAKVALIIESLIPYGSKPPSLPALQKTLRRHGVNTSFRTIMSVLDRLGYDRKRIVKKDEVCNAK